MNVILRTVAFKSSTVLRYLKWTPTVRSHATSILDVNTNVPKDVLLFSFENPRQIKMLNIFGTCQVFFWNYWAYLMFSTLKDVPVDESKIKEDDKWFNKINLGENKIKYALAATCSLIGNGLFLAAILYTNRCIRKLVLLRGGKTLAVSIYTPLGGTRTFTTPVSQVSSARSRDTSTHAMPIKVQNHRLYYAIDVKDGKFGNIILFDATVGLKRGFQA